MNKVERPLNAKPKMLSHALETKVFLVATIDFFGIRVTKQTQQKQGHCGTIVSIAEDKYFFFVFNQLVLVHLAEECSHGNVNGAVNFLLISDLIANIDQQ